ncbi:acyltransferase family protein, partial [Neorhizobium sp. BT27B]|uniref:acyltransferase n=1 Tax=Neorhizobium sp. BT27B TaxID=3142625 RepID=UPI003D2A35D3
CPPLFKWTPHAKAQSIAEGAEKFALTSYPTTEFSAWAFANAANSIGRVAVPMFIMMSGALIIGRAIPDWGSFFKHRSLVFLRPYLFGTIFYIVIGPTIGTSWPSPSQAVYQIMSGTAAYHLYFLPILFIMYVIAPLLEKADQIKTSNLVGVTAALFALATIERHVAPAIPGIGYFSLGLAPSYVPYFIAGYLLHKRWRMPLGIAAAGLSISTLLTFTLAWKYSMPQSAYPYSPDTFLQYTSFNVIAQSLFAFGLMNAWKANSLERYRSEIVLLSNATLGIYVLHLAFVEWIHGAFRKLGATVSTSELIIAPLAIFIVSLFITFGLRRVKLMRGFV